MCNFQTFMCVKITQLDLRYRHSLPSRCKSLNPRDIKRVVTRLLMLPRNIKFALHRQTSNGQITNESSRNRLVCNFILFGNYMSSLQTAGGHLTSIGSARQKRKTGKEEGGLSTHLKRETGERETQTKGEQGRHEDGEEHVTASSGEPEAMATEPPGALGAADALRFADHIVPHHLSAYDVRDTTIIIIICTSLGNHTRPC